MDLTALARGIIDASLDMTLANADEGSRPWASPELAIVMFDSGLPIGTGHGVYTAARAEQVADPDGGMGRRTPAAV